MVSSATVVSPTVHPVLFTISLTVRNSVVGLADCRSGVENIEELGGAGSKSKNAGWLPETLVG